MAKSISIDKYKTPCSFLFARKGLAPVSCSNCHSNSARKGSADWPAPKWLNVMITIRAICEILRTWHVRFFYHEHRWIIRSLMKILCQTQNDWSDLKLTNHVWLDTLLQWKAWEHSTIWSPFIARSQNCNVIGSGQRPVITVSCGYRMVPVIRYCDFFYGIYKFLNISSHTEKRVAYYKGNSYMV